MKRRTNRDRLLATAEELFLKKGYTGCTIDEICAAAGVSKGSVYHFFASKEELGLATLDRYYDDRIGQLLSGGYADLSDPVARVAGFFNHAADLAAPLWGKGSLLGGMAIDVTGTSPALAAHVAARMDDMARLLEELFAPALGKRAREAAPLAERFLAGLEGAVLLARVHRDPSLVSRHIHMFARGFAALQPG